MSRRWPLFLAIALAGATLDVAAKSFVFSRCSYGETLTLIPHLLWIQLATNRGIAWGLFPSAAWQAVSLAAVPLLSFFFLRQAKAPRSETVCGAFLVAGTLGNAWDRALLGYVRDFIVVPGVPNFNLADMMLTCGIAVLSLLWIVHDRRPVGDAGPAQAGEPHDGGVGDLGRDHGPRP
ncbi:MAG: signal peptidase II [Planctomycetes bacterium]|nr:signal peptidase II [Planctomycetota bacterium]